MQQRSLRKRVCTISHKTRMMPKKLAMSTLSNPMSSAHFKTNHQKTTKQVLALATLISTSTPSRAATLQSIQT